MKNNIRFILIAILIGTVFSCAKDDEVPPTLIGKWEFVSQIDYIAGVPEPNEKDYLFNVAGCKKSFYNFKGNNLMEFGRYSGGGCGLNIEEQRYIFDGKNFQTKFPLIGFNYEIKTLTQTDLVIDATDTNTPVGNTNYTIFTFKLKRIQ
jgi:hypothetical protein